MKANAVTHLPASHKAKGRSRSKKTKTTSKASPPPVIHVPQMREVSVTLPNDLVNRLYAFTAKRGLDDTDVVRIAIEGVLRKGKFYTLTTQLNFGKYHGETMETVIRLDPGYVHWALTNVEALSICPECEDLLQGMLHVARNG